MSESYVVAGARTPIGSFLGALSSLSATDLGAAAVGETLARSAIGNDKVDEVIMGHVLTAGAGQAPARQAALKAGLPNTIPAVTINKVCGSGLKAIMMADQVIRCGDANAIVAGGMESMSNAPHLARGLRKGTKLGDINMIDAMVFDGLTCSFDECHMGMHAEHIANKYSVTRQDQDEFAAESQKRAAKAQADGVFQDEIVSITVKSRKAEVTVSEDEGVRPDSNVEGLAKLRTVFDKEGTVTAGNASTLNDGAAAVMVTSAQYADEFSSPLKARIVSSYTSGTEPKDLFIAPVFAVRGALEKAGLTPEDIDLFEINEAFAAQMVACIRQLEIDPAKVNVYGGGIALGHPIGASGARVLVTLLHAMQRQDAKRGVAALCLGGGNAVAMVVER